MTRRWVSWASASVWQRMVWLWLAFHDSHAFRTIYPCGEPSRTLSYRASKALTIMFSGETVMELRP